MSNLWQITTVGAIVVLAFLYLGRRVWVLVHNPCQARCGGCMSCRSKGRLKASSLHGSDADEPGAHQSTTVHMTRSTPVPKP